MKCNLPGLLTPDERTTTLEKDNTKELRRVVHIDERKIRGHLDEMVRGTVEQTLNDLLDAEADRLCSTPKYTRSPERADRRA